MASCYTEPPTLSAWIHEEDEDEKESKSPQRSSSDESDESEPEPPPLASLVRRKVSFADAFGLDLVSVKEFDNRIQRAEGREREEFSNEGREREEFYLSCIFSVPASDEELEFRLRRNKLELERIELLPGSTTIRGTVRVLNLSYYKVVYVRTTLNGWQTHFDKLAQYVPGSSDGETDRFSFQLTLTPPFPPEGLRVELCLCFESSIGIFWSNNGGMNYVLFCHQRGGRALKEKEEEKDREIEENNQKGKKSCLKTIKKSSCSESKPMDRSSELSEEETSRNVESKKGKTQHEAENRSKNILEEGCKTLAERRNRRKAARSAYSQDDFSHRDTDVQLVQPPHAEKSNTDLNTVLPLTQSSIPMMTNISSTLQECKIVPVHQNTLLPVDWERNTSEIISGTRPDVPEKESDEDGSTELSNDVWKDFLNGIDVLDNNALVQKCFLCTAGTKAFEPLNTEYDVPNIGDKILSEWNSKDCAVITENASHQCFRAMGRLESDPAKLSLTLDPNHINDVMSYTYPEKDTSSEQHTVQESESVWVQWRPGGTEARNCRHTLRKRPSSEHEHMLLPKLGKTTRTKDATEQWNSKSGDRVLLDECTSCTVLVDMKVKADTHREVKDTLTLTRIGNIPFIERRGSLERQGADDIGEPLKKIERVREEMENRSHMKTMCWSKYTEEALVVLENKSKEDDEEPSRLNDRNTDICISSGTNLVCDKTEPQKQTECLDNGEDEAGWYELVEKGFSDSSRKQIGEISSVENSDGTNDLKTEGDGIYIRYSKSDDYIDKEVHKELFFPAPCKGFQSEETLRYRVAQNLQDQVVGTKSRTASPSVSRFSSWLMICWAKISNVSSITGAIVCAILCLIFVTAYLHDLPVCLAIYLLSACWWCRQLMKKDVTTADSVD